MKIKTAELTGRGLNAAVALALGAKIVKTPESQSWMFYGPPSLMNGVDPGWSLQAPDYCSDGLKAMQVLERECIGLECTGHCWEAYTAIEVADEDFIVPQFVSQTGPTSIIAIWRCFVTSKLGDEVEIPKELL